MFAHPSPAGGVSISRNPIWIKDQPIISNQTPNNANAQTFAILKHYKGPSNCINPIFEYYQNITNDPKPKATIYKTYIDKPVRLVYFSNNLRTYLMHLSWFMCPFGKFLHLCQPESFTFLSLFPPPSSSFKYRLLEVQYLLVVIKSICPSSIVASWSHIWQVLCLVLQRINIQDIANIINKHLVAMVIKSICPSTEATSLTQIWPVLCLVLQWMSKQSTTCTSNCKGGVQKTPFSFNHVLDVPCRPLEGLERKTILYILQDLLTPMSSSCVNLKKMRFSNHHHLCQTDYLSNV